MESIGMCLAHADGTILGSENYIVINGVTYDLIARTGKGIVAAEVGSKLANIPVAKTCKIGSHEMIILAQADGNTLLLRKKSLKDMEFGKNNNYDGSYVDEECQKFAAEIAAIVGEENMVEFTVDLTADDGLKCYGSIQRKAALLTANQFRKYVDVLEEHRLEDWEWTATAYSTPKHDNDRWVKCVSPSGIVNISGYDGSYGVRPFCILKSHIFVF